ncbi:ABC transporter permease [Pseudostreptobacillus sp.]
MINKKNVYIIIFIILIFSVKILNRFDPYSQDLQNTNLGLFAKGHILGTDILGRDILSRVIQGIMISMYIILLVYILSVTIGIVIGFLISYYSKKLDYIVSYIIEVFLSIPSLIIILFIVMFMGNKFWILIFALTLTRSLRMIIFVKNEVNKLKIQNFVYMSRIMGAKSIYIFKKHIFPNILDIVLVKASFMIPGIIFSETILSFMGVGVSLPNASLGNLLSTGFSNLLVSPIQFLVSSLSIIVLTLIFGGLNEGIKS